MSRTPILALALLCCSTACREAPDAMTAAIEDRPGAQSAGPAGAPEPGTHTLAMPSSLWLSQCSEPGGPAITAGPYVTDVTASSATIQVKTGAPSDLDVYLFESDGACRDEDVFDKGASVSARLVEQESVPFTQASDPIPSYLYEARFEIQPKPEPDRRYCYGISFPSKPWADPNRYYCRPRFPEGFLGTSFAVPGTDKAEPFSFYVYGDVRFPSGLSMVHLEVAGRMTLEMEADVRDGKKPASFVVNTGDYAYYGCDEALWLENFFAPARTLLQPLPIFTAPGNHEQYTEDESGACDNMPYYFSFFAPTYRGDGALPPGMYARDYKNTRLISLDIWDNDLKKNPKGTAGGLERDACSEQQLAMPCERAFQGSRADLSSVPCGYRWLQCQLQAPAGIDHIFVFHHAPTITAPPTGKHASSDFQIRTLAPLFERPDGVGSGKVTAVLTGHNHLYERSAPITDLCLRTDPGCGPNGARHCATTGTSSDFEFPDICWREDPVAGVTYLVSGCGGAEPYSAPDGPFPMEWLEAATNAYGHLRIYIDGPHATVETRGFLPDGSKYTDTALLR